MVVCKRPPPDFDSPRSRQTGPPPDSGLWQGNAPPWEKRFCASVGIPWDKILNSKRHMQYHVNVLNWNDTAGEEAFLNAKQRFWEDINGIPCSIFLPDPDIYNDDIDWNESRNSDKANSRVSSCATEGHYRKPDSGDPWEHGCHGTESMGLKNVEIWGIILGERTQMRRIEVIVETCQHVGNSGRILIMCQKD